MVVVRSDNGNLKVTTIDVYDDCPSPVGTLHHGAKLIVRGPDDHRRIIFRLTSVSLRLPSRKADH